MNKPVSKKEILAAQSEESDQFDEGFAELLELSQDATTPKAPVFSLEPIENAEDLEAVIPEVLQMVLSEEGYKDGVSVESYDFTSKAITGIFWSENKKYNFELTQVDAGWQLKTSEVSG
jgi:hypothetical protein